MLLIDRSRMASSGSRGCLAHPPAQLAPAHALITMHDADGGGAGTPQAFGPASWPRSPACARRAFAVDVGGPIARSLHERDAPQAIPVPAPTAPANCESPSLAARARSRPAPSSSSPSSPRGPPPGPGQENRDLRTFFFQIKKLDVWSWGPRHGTARHGTARHGTARQARRRRERHRSAPHALARSVLARCWLEAAGRASRTDGQGAREAATPHAARRTPHAARRTPHAGQTPEPGAQTRSKALDAQEPGAARRAGVTV